VWGRLLLGGKKSYKKEQSKTDWNERKEREVPSRKGRKTQTVSNLLHALRRVKRRAFSGKKDLLQKENLPCAPRGSAEMNLLGRML